MYETEEASSRNVRQSSDMLTSISRGSNVQDFAGFRCRIYAVGVRTCRGNYWGRNMTSLRRAVYIALAFSAFAVAGVCSAHDKPASIRVVVSEVPPGGPPTVAGGEIPLVIPNPSYSNVPDVVPWPRNSYGYLETGSGTLEIFTDKTGRAWSVIVLKSTGYNQLDRAELFAAQHWVFSPAHGADGDIPGNLIIPFSFDLPAGFVDPYKPTGVVPTPPTSRPASIKLDAQGVPSSSPVIFANGGTYLARIPNPSYSNVPDIAPWPLDGSGRPEEGSGTLLIQVDKDGSAKSISIEKSSGNSQLDTLEVWAAQHWQFRPELKDNVDVAGLARVPFEFSVPAGLTDSKRPLDTDPAAISPQQAENPTTASGQRGGAFGRGVVKVAGFVQKASLYFLEGLAEGAAQPRTVGQGATRYSAPPSGYVATAYWTGRQTQVTTVTYKMAWNCEYRYNGQTFWRIFGYTCPLSVQVQ